MAKQVTAVEKTTTYSAYSHGEVENAAGPAGVAIAPPAAEWATLEQPLQAQLTIGPVNDPYEREADQIANQVMRMPAPDLQRQTCACGKPARSDGMCADCQRHQQTMQRVASPGLSPTIAPPIVHQVLQQSGQPLNNATRTAMESRFGTDFSQVKVHTDRRAAESARAVNARAYTVGQNVVFGAGQYEPTAKDGRQLLAHELVHTLQQSQGNAQSVQRIPEDEDSLHQPLIEDYRNQVGLPPGGIDPTSGQPVGPTDAEIKYGGTLQEAGLSVSQPEYRQRLQQALATMQIPIIQNWTLAEFVRPMLASMVSQATFRDPIGRTSGGGMITYTLPGSSGVTLQLQLILDDQPDPPRAGSFAPASATEGTLTLYIRENSTVNEIAVALYHEAMHMVGWIIRQQGLNQVQAGDPRAAQMLDLNRHRSFTTRLRRHLDLLAQDVNAHRLAGNQITPAQLDHMATWLTDELAVRVESNVFDQLLQHNQQQRQGRSRGRGASPQGITILPTQTVDARVASRYIFIHSRVFTEADQQQLSAAGRQALATLIQAMSNFYDLQSRRRMTLSLFTPSPPPQMPTWQPPPLTPPPFRPLPLP